MPALVIAPEEEEGVGIPHFEGPEVQHTLRTKLITMVRDYIYAYFNAEVPPINIIAEEEVPCICGGATHLE